MRDYRKIILIWLALLTWITILWLIVYFTISYFFEKERPPLNIQQASIINYKWTYDNIKLDEYWVEFDVRSWWEITKDSSKYQIKWDKYSLDFKIIPFDIFKLNTEESLHIHKTADVKYTKKENIELIWEYSSVYNKKRWDIFITKNYKLIRVLEKSSFKNNNIPVSTFEEISWNKEEIIKIFMSYVIKSEEKLISDKYVLDNSDKKEWLEYHSYFQSNKKKDYDYDYDVIWFWWVYNTLKTEELINTLLTNTNKKYIDKYSMDLNNEELELYRERIKKDFNKYFNSITFIRYIIQNDNIYKFRYISNWSYIEFKHLLNNDYSEFFFKGIKISKPIQIEWGNQLKWNNIQFLVPYLYSVDKENNRESLVLLPNVKRYNRWWILLRTIRKKGRDESMWDVYNKQVRKYVTESLSISNETIKNVILIKSDEIELWWFKWKGNVFKFETVNNDDFIFIEYILFDKNNYYTIWFNYWEDEKELLKSFEQLIKSVNKIK